VIVRDGEVVGDHGRQFGRGKTVFDPWHYLPVLERKPGALRNGAPFKGGSAGGVSKDTGEAQEILYGLGSAVCGILHAVVLYGLDVVAEPVHRPWP